MSMFNLAISCLTTSNLPWVMEVTFQVPVHYCSLQYLTTSITSHIHNWVLLLLWLCPFILSGVISPLTSSSILGIYPSGEFIFQCPIFFVSSYCSCGSQGKNTEVVWHSFLQWTTFYQNSPPRPVHLGWPYTSWLSSLIPRMSMFTLSISCLTTCNLPWFMDLTFKVPMQHFSLQHQILLLSPVTSTTGYSFALAPSLHSFWSYFSTDLQEHIWHLLT